MEGKLYSCSTTQYLADHFRLQDPSTGVAPFLYPLSPASTDLSLPPFLKILTVPLSTILGATRTLLVILLLLGQTILVEGILSIFVSFRFPRRLFLRD